MNGQYCPSAEWIKTVSVLCPNFYPLTESQWSIWERGGWGPGVSAHLLVLHISHRGPTSLTAGNTSKVSIFFVASPFLSLSRPSGGIERGNLQAFFISGTCFSVEMEIWGGDLTPCCSLSPIQGHSWGMQMEKTKKTYKNQLKHSTFWRDKGNVWAALAFKVNPDVQSCPNKQGAFLLKPNPVCVSSQHWKLLFSKQLKEKREVSLSLSEEKKISNASKADERKSKVLLPFPREMKSLWRSWVASSLGTKLHYL